MANLTKKCLKCEITFSKPKNYSYKQWEAKKYCSNKCGTSSLLHQSPFKKGRKVSKEIKYKLSASTKKWQIGRTGELANAWRGGPTERDLIQYKIWRKAVFERDHNQCVWCSSIERLEADHIKSFLNYPELRYVVSNGRTLCHDCHTLTPNYGSKAKGERNVILSRAT